MAAKKKTTKTTKKKAAKKSAGKSPLEVLEERLEHLTNIVRRRRARG